LLIENTLPRIQFGISDSAVELF